MAVRTTSQQNADDMDCQLYRLIGEAEHRAKVAAELNTVHSRVLSKAWGEVAAELRSARVVLRSRLMHTDDVDATSPFVAAVKAARARKE